MTQVKIFKACSTSLHYIFRRRWKHSWIMAEQIEDGGQFCYVLALLQSDLSCSALSDDDGRRERGMFIIQPPAIVVFVRLFSFPVALSDSRGSLRPLAAAKQRGVVCRLRRASTTNSVVCTAEKHSARLSEPVSTAIEQVRASSVIPNHVNIIHKPLSAVTLNIYHLMSVLAT